MHEYFFMCCGYVDLDEFGYPYHNLSTHKRYNQFKYQARIHQLALELAEVDTDTNDKVFLDIGCGYGGGLSFIKDHYDFKSLIGIDIDPNYIEYAHSNVPNVNFICGSATDIPLLNSSVDVILNMETFGFFLPYEKYLSEASRVLQNGGKLIYVNAEHEVEEYHELFETYGFILEKKVNIAKNIAVAASIQQIRYFTNNHTEHLDYFNTRINNFLLNKKQFYIKIYSNKK